MRPLIEGSEGLVHEQEPGPAEQGPADRYSLRFTTRETGRSPFEQMAKPQQVDDALEGDAVAAAAGEGSAIAKVPAYREMRHQSRLLEHHADTPAMNRHGDPALRVEQRLTGHRNATPIRSRQPGDEIDHRGFARTRATEQGGQARAGGERDLEAEGAPVQRDVDIERRGHRGPHPVPRRRARRRASSSDTRRAVIDRATEIRVRRKAPASPPGTCVRL